MVKSFQGAIATALRQFNATGRSTTFAAVGFIDADFAVTGRMGPSMSAVPFATFGPAPRLNHLSAHVKAVVAG